ncbi:uncharacterized protein LOC113750517 [Coffea eugenioides]|uniref:uncharacterized protein LOC113750517 n=1 Tax=Coffea eugenioides TaxID=49369 RepID=UPI000F6101AD|nr:uncharacterized protein LOC113750517 [Coffea eugenioides]
MATVEKYVKDKKKIDAMLQRNLKLAQKRMKRYADEHRSERKFQVGDWVHLKLQPYRKTTVVLRNNTKLFAKYFGPYQVEEKIESAAYRLKLPAESKIHPVFHVSLLKKKLGGKASPVPHLPATDEKGQLRVELVALLG